MAIPAGSAIQMGSPEEEVLTGYEVRVRTLSNGDRHIALLKPGRKTLVLPLDGSGARALGNALAGSLEIATSMPKDKVL